MPLDAAERSPLSGRSLMLSKSKIMAFKQCPKRLWLQVHRPVDAEYDQVTLSRFATGHRFGALARRTEPEGILVDTGRDFAAAVAATSDLLNRTPARPIFEAALVHEDVVIRADILKPVDGSGFDWDLVEVKHTRQPRDGHVQDVAVQAWVASAHIQLRRVLICHPTRMISAGRSFQRNDFRFQDVTDQAASYQRTCSGVAASARHLLRGQEPRVATGSHCSSPYCCEFRRYCRAVSGASQ